MAGVLLDGEDVVGTVLLRDRAEAGRARGEALAPLISRSAVVAAIPSGGGAVALPIVDRLRLPLALFYARKLAASIAPEAAFGALDEDRETTNDPGTVVRLGRGLDEVARAGAPVRADIERRMALDRVSPLGQCLPRTAVVLIDDHWGIGAAWSGRSWP